MNEKYIAVLVSLSCNVNRFRKDTTRRI